MKKTMIAFVMLFMAYSLFSTSVTVDDFRFLIEREQHQLIQKYWDDFQTLKDSQDLVDRRLLLDYAQRTDDLELAFDLHYNIARDFGSIEDALQWLILQTAIEKDSLDIALKTQILAASFSNPADSLVFAFYASGAQDSLLVQEMQALEHYNDIIEANAKSLLDEISTLSSNYEAIELAEEFYASFPQSKWHQAAFYMHLNHLASLKDYEEMQSVIYANQNRSAAHAYIAALFWMSPTARRDQCEEESSPILNQNLVYRAQKALFAASQANEAVVLYDVYDKDYWHSRINLQLLKSIYYYKVSGYEGKDIPFGSLYGDEPDLIGLITKPDKEMEGFFDVMSQIHFDSNDKGELAEYHYWKGKVNALFNTDKHKQQAIKDFGQCLIYGSPRNRYDHDAYDMIARLLANMKIQQSPEEYLREIFEYDGIMFESQISPFMAYTRQDPSEHVPLTYTRVALADYDNDGLLDILLNGKHIFKNEGDWMMHTVSDSGAVASLASNGGLWADFNKDGTLDFMSISHNAEGNGEALLKGQGNGHFVKVNERAGEIDNGYPTEGAAFIDIDGKGFPSLYLANYETWQQRSGYPDNFFYNYGGYFSDQSLKRGFLLPEYTQEPGLAGRGVAPADFDNDGKQEILVTNYRLNRNFLFKQVDSLFIDIAALYGVTGQYKNAYYGHSIGADWGDIDNDGDLDLFVANLAHPRYIEISDISQLLRNDGLQHRIVGADTLYYWQFTDITKAAGITYDELHSEPLFFDADNDGDLDLYITSVYENERSYLYRNNGDSTFTDITWLSGARVYNGWGCAAGDLDRDGKLDLVIGSGSGTAILANVSSSPYKSILLKPIHKGRGIDLLPVNNDMPKHPNSPAFGTRVLLWKENARGERSELIRELSSAKGTTTQNAPELHFGLGDAIRFGFEIWEPKP